MNNKTIIKTKKAIKYFIIALLILILPFIIILANFYRTGFDEKYYEKEFVKYNIYDRFTANVQNQNIRLMGINPSNIVGDINAINKQLLTYLKPVGLFENDNSDEIQTEFFNNKEKIHLVEVKELIAGFFSILTYFIICFLLLMVILYFLDQKILNSLGIVLLFGGGFTILIILLFAFIMGVGGAYFGNAFDTAFINFHLTFFKTNTWILNPMTDNLINMFPEGFFYDIFAKIILNSFIWAVVMGIVGFVIMFRKRLKMKLP